MANNLKNIQKRFLKSDILKQLRENEQFIKDFGYFVKGEAYSFFTVKHNWLYGKVPHILADINNLEFIKLYLGYNNIDDLLEVEKELSLKLATERVGAEL